MKDIKNNSVKADVSGSISVCKGRSGNVQFWTKSYFFSQEVTVKVTDNKIIFSHIGIDYIGKSSKFHLRDGWYNSSILAEIPIGKYDFEQEESNEDVVTIYYR